MSAIDLGKIMVTLAGDWASAGSYEILTVVRHNGGSYISITDNTGVEPGTDDSVWLLFAEDGDSSVLTIDDDGKIYKNGELFTTILADAKSLIDSATEAEADRVLAEQGRADAELQRARDTQDRLNACDLATRAANAAAASVPAVGEYVSPSDIVFSTDIEADKLNETKFVSPKAVYDFVVAAILSTI